MPEDRETKRHGVGIYSRYSKRKRRDVYTVEYYWHGKRCFEIAPEEYQRVTGRGKKETVRLYEAAKALRADRKEQRNQSDWMPPKVRRELESKEQEVEQERRAPLLFDEARDRFLEECGDTYSSRSNVDSAFRILSRFFAGRMLDEVSRLDIRKYYTDRLGNSGAFADWPRTVSRRVPDTEIGYLRAIFLRSLLILFYAGRPD